MRKYIALAAALALPSIANSKSRIVEPCQTEKAAVEATNNQIAESTTLTVELRTFLLSEKEDREGRLADRLQYAETRMQQTNQRLLLETQILQALVTARSNLDRLALAVPRLSAFATLSAHSSSATAIDEILKQQQNAIDSEAVADLKILIHTVRQLEKSSRNWRALVGNQPPQSLADVLDSLVQSHSALHQAVMNGPAELAAAKRDVAAAQASIATSLLQRRDREAQLMELERRISVLQQNLPAQKRDLHTCTRRSQFGE